MSVPELARRYPLDDVLQPGRYGAIRPEGPGVRLAACRDRSLVQVTARRERGRAVASLLGIAETPGLVQACPEGLALWTAPGSWLVLNERGAPVAAPLRARLGKQASLVDLSHARAGIRVSGPQTLRVLEKGCRLDLHPARFPPGRCAGTIIAGIQVLLWHGEADRDAAAQDGPCFELLMYAGFGQAFWEWLTEMAGPVGFEVYDGICTAPERRH